MDILLTYDVADTEGAGAKRLRRIAQVCQKYGERVQLSVFECRVSPATFARLIGEVQDAMDDQLDSVIVYRFAGKIEDARSRYGKIRGRELGDPWII